MRRGFSVFTYLNLLFMKKIKISFSAILLCLSCTKQKVEIEKPYIISVENKKIELARKKNSIPSPPFHFYAENHIVILKNQELYFYQCNRADILWDCIPHEELIPPFKGLEIEKMINVTNVSLDSFFKNNILNKERTRRHLIIASQNDTVKNRSLLKSIIKSKIPMYFFRRSTQEEDTVV